MREIIQTTATGVTIHIPAIPNGWQAALVLAAVALAFALFLGLLKNWKRLRRRRFPARPKGTPWWLMGIFLFSAVFAPFWAILFLRTFSLTFDVFGVANDLLASDDETALRETLRWYALALVGLLTALGGLLAAPLAIIRTHATERQTRTAEENLTTDLINKAVEGLGAQKEVSRLGRNVVFERGGQQYTLFHWAGDSWNLHEDDKIIDEETTHFTPLSITLPNIEVRLGAIYALERIAQDSPRDHIRVMEILCAYLRENAPARDAQPNPLGPWPEYPDNATEDDLRTRAKALAERRETLDLWVGNLHHRHAPRVDIQAAITVIGRRSTTQTALEKAPKENGTPGYRLDLRKVNLQAADLSRLNIAAAQLDAARMEGANLTGAHLEQVSLVGAKLERARLDNAHLEGAFLAKAQLEKASLAEAHLERADLGWAHLENADLVDAHLENARLTRAHLEGARLVTAHLERASLVGTHLELASLVNAHMDRTELVDVHLKGANLSGAYMGRAVLEAARLERTRFVGAYLVGADLFGAHLEGAEFFEARLEGAHLREVHLSNKTSFDPITLRGASLQAFDLSIAATKNDDLPRLLSEAFGDASVILPNGLKAGDPPLDHWSTETLDWSDFQTAWRAHQRAIGYTPPD